MGNGPMTATEAAIKAEIRKQRLPEPPFMVQYMPTITRGENKMGELTAIGWDEPMPCYRPSSFPGLIKTCGKCVHCDEEIAAERGMGTDREVISPTQCRKSPVYREVNAEIDYCNDGFEPTQEVIEVWTKARVALKTEMEDFRDQKLKDGIA